jgi:hypothetical protein
LDLLAEALSVLDADDIAAVAARAEREGRRLRRQGNLPMSLVYESIGLTAESALAHKLLTR